MISNTLHSSIVKALAADPFFSVTDFQLSPTETRSNIVVEITYLPHSDYKFVARIDRTKTKVDGKMHPVQLVQLVIAPGEMAFHENSTTHDPEGLLSGLRRWLERIKEEIQAAPIARRVAEHGKRLDELLESVGEIEEGAHFTAGEVEKLRARLDAMEQQIAADLEVRIQDKAKLEGNLNKLSAEVEALKLQVAVFEKKSILRRFGEFTLKWFSRPENQRLAAEAMTKLLGSGEPK